MNLNRIVEKKRYSDYWEILKLKRIKLLKGDKLPISKTPTRNFGGGMHVFCGKHLTLARDCEVGYERIEFVSENGSGSYGWEITDIDLEQLVAEREV